MLLELRGCSTQELRAIVDRKWPGYGSAPPFPAPAPAKPAADAAPQPANVRLPEALTAAP